MTYNYTLDVPASVREAGQKRNSVNRSWYFILGSLLIILGLFAMSFPFMTAVAARRVLGGIFMFAGFLQVIRAVLTPRVGEFLASSVIGTLYTIAGGLLAFFPLAGILNPTVLIVIVFVAHGALEAMAAFTMRQRATSSWVLFAGLMPILIGYLLLIEPPNSTVWAIGLLVGVAFVSWGLACLIFAILGEEKPMPPDPGIRRQTTRMQNSFRRQYPHEF